MERGYKSIQKTMKTLYAILVITAMGFLMNCTNVKPDFTEKIIDHVPQAEMSSTHST